MQTPDLINHLLCAAQLLASDGQLFRQRVQDSLRRQIIAINYLADRGMFFWDYGNAFLLEAQRCGADVCARDDPTGLKFRYPSYVQDIMGWVLKFGFDYKASAVAFVLFPATSFHWDSARSAGSALRHRSWTCKSRTGSHKTFLKALLAKAYLTTSPFSTAITSSGSKRRARTVW